MLQRRRDVDHRLAARCFLHCSLTRDAASSHSSCSISIVRTSIPSLFCTPPSLTRAHARRCSTPRRLLAPPPSPPQAAFFSFCLLFSCPLYVLILIHRSRPISSSHPFSFPSCPPPPGDPTISRFEGGVSRGNSAASGGHFRLRRTGLDRFSRVQIAYFSCTRCARVLYASPTLQRRRSAPAVSPITVVPIGPAAAATTTYRFRSCSWSIDLPHQSLRGCCLQVLA